MKMLASVALVLAAFVFNRTTIITYGTAFPASPAPGATFVVTDDSAEGACDSAAGSSTTLCRWNGSIWQALTRTPIEVSSPVILTNDTISLQDASAVRSGAVSEEAQEFAGEKTFNDGVVVPAGEQFAVTSGCSMGTDISCPQNATLGGAMELSEGADESPNTETYILQVQDVGGIVASGTNTGGGFAAATNICTLHLSGRIPGACLGDGNTLVTGTGSDSHGAVLWGVRTATDAAFDTGTEVCVAANLTCVTTFDTWGTGIACGDAHTVYDGWPATCK